MRILFHWSVNVNCIHTCFVVLNVSTVIEWLFLYVHCLYCLPLIRKGDYRLFVSFIFSLNYMLFEIVDLFCVVKSKILKRFACTVAMQLHTCNVIK